MLCSLFKCGILGNSVQSSRMFVLILGLAFVVGDGVVAPKKVEYTVTKTYSHQSSCFTEGLFLYDTGASVPDVFESCGLTGSSYIRRFGLGTDNTLQRGAVPPDNFGEGIAILGERFFLLTYQAGIMIEYKLKTMEPGMKHDFPYGEGWGLTTDGCDLLATTGDSFIYRLRLNDDGEFQLASKTKVTNQGIALPMLNELEYVTPKLWVNEWRSDRIWRVDPFTGVCEMYLDISRLYTWRGEATPNGIAYSHKLGSANTLLVTGKMWPEMHLLTISPKELCGFDKPLVKSRNDGICLMAPLTACWTGVDEQSEVEAPIDEFALPAKNETAADFDAVTNRIPRRPSFETAYLVIATPLSFILLVCAVGVPIYLRKQRIILREAVEMMEVE